MSMSTVLYNLIVVFSPVTMAMQESRWQPYLDLVPNHGGSEPPMLWCSRDQLRLLRGTGVLPRVAEDGRNMEEDFREIVLPFMEKHPHVFK